MPGGNTDAEVVRTEDLADILNTWLEKYTKQFPLSFEFNPRGNRGRPESISGLQYLSQLSGLSDRAIYRVINCESKHTRLTIADKLLIVIDREYMLSTGELEIIPNPSWSLEHWQAYMSERGCL